MSPSTEPLDSKYREHPVFTQLPRYAEFYEAFSMSILPFSTQGTRAIWNIDSYVYSSMQGTLESIGLSLGSGRIGDAYALLRRYHDSAIINVYANVYLQDHFSLEIFVVAQIQDWLNGKTRLPEFRVMSEYIRKSSRLAPITALLFGDSTYSKTRDRCNDFMHYNFFMHMLSNDNQVYLKDRIAILDSFSADLENLIILHTAMIFFLNDHYMMSSDYLDHMECGMTPPKNSQHFVAPFIQELFDSVIKKRRMDIFREIKKATSMQLV